MNAFRNGFILTILLAARTAGAICGDVNGDDKLSSSDALRVLRAAVGQNVALQCNIEVEVQNSAGYLNLLSCNGYGFTSKLTWSEHPSLTWSSFTNPGDGDPHYKRVDDLEVGGYLDVTFGSCGSLRFDIDEWDVHYPLPIYGAAIFLFTLDVENDLVVLWVADAPVSGAAYSAGAEQTPSPTRLASMPAPPGLR